MSFALLDRSKKIRKDQAISNQPPQVLQGINTEEMLDKFSQNQDKNEVVEILKELFDHKKLNKITDLTPDAINLIIAIDTIGDTMTMPIYKKITSHYIELQLSKNRKSRQEIVEAIKGAMTQKTTGDKIRDVFTR
jgi:predicted DNA-binding protein YlxM (UPF0122 family)